MKRVLFVISYLDKGGAERALSNLTMNMPAEWEIDILVNSDKVIDYPYKGNIITLGVNQKPKTSSLFFQLLVFLKRVFFLSRIKRENGYIACISFLDSANIANILSGKKYCRVVVSVRSSLIQEGQLPQYKYVVNPLVKLLYDKADRVAAVSKGIAQELSQVFKLKADKICTIENGYSIEELVTLSRERLSEEEELLFKNKIVCIAVGRLTEAKAYWHLIRAYASVCDKIEDTILFILGEGELKGYLSELIQLYNLEEKVILLGFVRNPYKYMRKADFFVMSSMYEGFPNAMAEAMCLGVPCIATDFRTGARELLEPKLVSDEKDIREIRYAEFGVITPLCSGKKYYNEKLEQEEDILAKAIEILCRDEKIRNHYAAQSRKRSEELGIERVVKQWLRLIQGE